MLPSRRMIVMGGNVFRDEYSLAFDGSNDCIKTSGDGTAADATYTFWAKASTTGANYGVFGHGGNNIGAFHFNNSSKPLLWLHANLYQYWVDTSAQDDGQWHHWAVVVDLNDMTACKLYVDGVEQSQDARATSGTATAYSESLVIGGDKASSGNYCACNISDFAWYDTMLTDSQVKTIYNGREPYNHLESSFKSNLKGWWRMGDGTLDEFKDNGLICDEITPTIGNEIVSNGTFTGNATGWTLGSPWAYDDNNVSIDGSQSGNVSLTTGSFTAGKCYRVEFEISDYSNGNTNPHIRGNNSGTVTGDGVHISYIVSGSSTNNVNIYSDSQFDASVDNVSVKLIGGNAGQTVNMSANDIEGDVP